MTVGIGDIEAAAATIAGDVVRTPMSHSLTLSAIVGAEVVVKFENLQFTGSFKERGAANRLRSLPPEVCDTGIIALSAGNHAQGVAHVATRLGIPATIVMPATAPFNKVVNTRALGATVVQHGSTFAEAWAKLDELRDAEGLTFIPPYDDPSIIAGQGTVALEMLADDADLDAIVVPVGGGGLVAGTAVVVKALRPDVEVIGVEIDSYDAVSAAIGGRPPPSGGVDTLADGIAVVSLGDYTVPIISALVDDVITVDETAVEEAIAYYLEIEKTVAEGAGAVPLAALLRNRSRFAGRRVGLVLSGGNIDMRVLASVLMRSLVRTDRISTLRVELGDLPGQLAPVVTAVASAGANIVEIDHRRLFDPISARHTNVDLVVETRDAEHRERVIDAIAALDHAVERLR